MKYQFYFTGYSDDIVLAGSDRRSLDEYGKTFYMMSNGALVKAEQGPRDDPDHPGWKITCEHPSAIRIAATSEDVEHTDERIPAWLDAPSYADVLIIESDEPLEIISVGAKPIKPLTPLGLVSANIAKDLNAGKYEDEGGAVTIQEVEDVIKKHLERIKQL